ncbi:nuclease [Kineobactrum sediminis]|uniref:Nuclease n=1 Tax=Kineobactrum sediminis TaxID=1905677 RepID=A0A2N5Y4D8_9GAMM|nr:nuclease-related domain-containing protein [Kineobactrum sediminis]PLW83242.1 nuclease [Kineobactrum sediminis]
MKTKSPLTSKPLRNPGESLELELQDVLYDGILYWVVTTIVVTVLAGMEWWRWYAQIPPSPKVMTGFAFLLASYSAWRVAKSWRHIKNLKLGLAGEKAVGQFLERLREHGAKVFHDIPGDKFNLDHVVIHRSGIYVVETKTWSKPDRGEAKLVFDGERVLKNGKEMDRNGVAQVAAGSRWLAELLKESTGRVLSVRPVLVYPGWFIQPTAEAKSSKVWVLNPKVLPAFINNSRETLTPEDVHLCSYHLTKYIQGM